MLFLLSCLTAPGQAQDMVCESPDLCDLKAGNVTLHVVPIQSVSSIAIQLKDNSQPQGTPNTYSIDLKDFAIKLNGEKLISLQDIQQALNSTGTTFTPSEIATAINSLNKGVVAQILTGTTGANNVPSLVLRTTEANFQKQLSVVGLPSEPTPLPSASSPSTSSASSPQSAPSDQDKPAPSRHPEPQLKLNVSGWRNFVISISESDLPHLKKDHTKVSLRLSNGSLFTLYAGNGEIQSPWTYVSDRGASDRGRLVVLRFEKVAPQPEGSDCPGKTPSSGCSSTSGESDVSDCPNASAKLSDRCAPCRKDWFAQGSQSVANSYGRFCVAEFVIVRRSVDGDDSSITPKEEKLVVAMMTTAGQKLEIHQNKLVGSEYHIDNAVMVSQVGLNGGALTVNAGAEPWLIEWFGANVGCRLPSHQTGPYYTYITVNPPELDNTLGPTELTKYVDKANGIVVGSAKVFDVLALKRMLNDTANQLAGLSVFNVAQISGAVGNLQGITRDTSFLSAQVTTAATPGISQSSSVGVTTPNTAQTTTPVGSTTVTLQCPDGSLPTIGSSTTLGGCAAVPLSGNTANVPVYAPVSNSGGVFQGTLTTTPAGSTVTNTGSTNTTQNGTTITTPSVSGSAPAPLTGNPLAPPTNVGVGSSDILAEQVQLNAQMVSLRLLLQGALSDQFLSRNSTAIATRRQTTMGFSVSLDPPPQYKHAVAEVRVIIGPPNDLDSTQNSVSVMNLLPSEKTYNVARVTSHQNQFGAGAIIEPISVGVSTGKSKDRLYLAKDTDTLALQFRPQARPVTLPLPQSVHDAWKSALNFHLLGTCSTDDGDVPVGALVFGWQFRPVLGQDYVKGGPRQVYAQLALPIGLRGHFAPEVVIQTRWREYDSKRQIVGAVYSDSCSSKIDRSGVMLTSDVRVDDMDMADLGAGQISLKAHGQFYSSSLGVITGANTLIPRAYDGTTIEVDSSAHDLLQAGELSIIDPNGQTGPFAVAPNPRRACGIINSEMQAVPYPDGNSRVTLSLGLGGDYNVNNSADGPPHPLILIGDAVYGLKETPFLDYGSFCFTMQTGTQNPAHTTCQYSFTAPTTSLRNAQTFLVRDLTWVGFSKVGSIQFSPSLVSLAISSSYPVSEGATTMFYTMSGFDLGRLHLRCSNFDSVLTPCIRVFTGDQERPLNQIGFTIQTNNVATFLLSSEQAGKSKTVRFQLEWERNNPTSKVEWALTIPKDIDAASKPTPSPAFLRVGDSQKVSFTGGSLCQSSPPAIENYTVLFQGAALAATCKNPGSSSASLEVTVSTVVTTLFGRKEFTVTAVNGVALPAEKQVTLPIDVLRQ